MEPEKLADVLKLDIENVIKMLGYLEAKYDESGSGLRLIRVDGKYQICTREAYADGVRALLEIKKIRLSARPHLKFWLLWRIIKR